MIVTFESVSLKGTKQVKCPLCGRRVTRHRTFWQTINPFNRRLDGLPKTREDIMAELRQEVEEWRHQPETCRTCQQTGEQGSDGRHASS